MLANFLSFFLHDLALQMDCFCSTFPTMSQSYVTKLSDNYNKLGHRLEHDAWHTSEKHSEKHSDVCQTSKN